MNHPPNPTNRRDALQQLPEMLKQNGSRSGIEFGKRIEALYMKFGIVAFPEQRQPIIEKYRLKE